jgi:hypothetical protein
MVQGGELVLLNALEKQLIIVDFGRGLPGSPPQNQKGDVSLIS